MKPPEFNNQQEYFDHNKEVWDKSIDYPLEIGAQVIVQTFALPMDEPLDLDSEHGGFIPLYYRAVYKGMMNEKYCTLETLAGSHFSSVVVEQVKIVPKEFVWEIPEE